MRLTRKDGLYDITDDRPNSTASIRNFVHLNTSLTESQYLEIESYPSALELAVILSWQSTSMNPLVQSRLNKLTNKAHIKKQFQKMSGLHVAELPSSTIFYQKLIKDFKNSFTQSELEDVIDQNDEFNIIIGTYRVQNGKQFIREDKKLGSNADATNILFIINGVSNNPDIVFLVYCTTLELHQRKIKQWQIYRSSYVFQKDKNDLNISRDSNSSVNLIQQKKTKSQLKRSKQDQNIGVQALQEQDHLVGHCKDCQNPKVLDPNNRQCWRCFRKSSEDGLNIIFLIFFLFFLGFLLVLNYYHAWNNQTISESNSFQLLNNFGTEAYQTLYAAFDKLKTLIVNII